MSKEFYAYQLRKYPSAMWIAPILKIKKGGDNNPFVIKEIVRSRFLISDIELSGTCRKEKYVFPRQIAMYLIRKFTGLSYENIGILFGGKHHTTVINSVKIIENYIYSDHPKSKTIKELEAKAMIL